MPDLIRFLICIVRRYMKQGTSNKRHMISSIVYETGDIIDTLVYRLGLENQQYSLSAAVGLLRSVISCVLVLLGYKLADKYAGYRVW